MKRFYGILGVLLMSSFAAGRSSAQAGPPPVQGQGAPPAQAGQTDQDQQTQKDPNQGVARISLIQGDASTQRGDSGDWMAATLNGAVVSGDKVSTADGARMELQLDFANILRLSGNTEADIADFTHNHIQLQIAQGLINYTVLKTNQADLEIDTPNVGVQLLREGTYRIQVNSANETVVIVRDGEVELSTPSGSIKVGKGEMATIRGVGTDAEYKKSDASSKDDWDKWNEDRDRAMEKAQSWKHVNPYYTGATIWTTTALGAKRPITGRSGRPIRGRTGLPTAMAIGFGNRITVGLGCLMSLGAGPPITTGAGFNTAVRGAGGRGLSMPDMNQNGRLRMYLFSDMAQADSALTLVSDLDSGTSAGSRSGHAIRSSPGGDGAADSDLVSSASTTSIGSVGADVIGMISTADSPVGAVLSLGGLISGSPTSAKLPIIRAYSTAYPQSARINSGTALS